MTRRFSIAVSLALALLVLVGSRTGYAQAPPDFPSLADQLRNDNVIPGSALERFIRANQDFALLRPEESKDKLGLPPWLRVAFRKAHPDGTYSGADPTGGYPRWLGDVHSWMVTHQDLRPSALPKPRSQVATQILTGPPAVTDPNRRISGAQPGARSESNIRIDPWNSNWIVAASNSLGSNRNQAQFYSTDGGTTWNQTALDFVASDFINGDPSVDWTSDGTAWTTTLGIETSTLNSRLRSYLSFNQGAAWAFDATASGSQTAVDKPMLWADHGSASSFRDRIYAVWDIPGGAAYVNYRTGPSGSWSTPQQVSGPESVGTAVGSDIKANGFGDVFVFWPATGNHALILRKSTTGATSFGAATSIAVNRGCPSCGTFGSFQIAVPAFITQFHKPLIYIAGAAYRTSTKDLVYASWTDLTGAAGCSQPGDEPGTNVASTCKTRIWFSRSTDGGSTWGTPTMVNNQSSLNDQFNQWLAVDDTTGVLGLIYYDTVADAGRLKTDVWYQSSYDDGVTWGLPLKITTAQTDETAAGADTNNRYGDYNGLSAYGGVFLPSWTDRRSGGREEIWTASVSDSPTPAPANLHAAALSQSQISLTWGAVSGTDHYEIQRSSGGGAYSLLASTGSVAYTDQAVTSVTTYVYRVRAVTSAGVRSAFSNIDLATTQLFADVPIQAQATRVKAQHIRDLRQAVNAVQVAAGQVPSGWTTLSEGTVIQKVHIEELRTAVSAARAALGFSDSPFTDPTLTAGQSVVRKVHIDDLRLRVKGVGY